MNQIMHLCVLLISAWLFLEIKSSYKLALLLLREKQLFNYNKRSWLVLKRRFEESVRRVEFN